MTYYVLMNNNGRYLEKTGYFLPKNFTDNVSDAWKTTSKQLALDLAKMRELKAMTVVYEPISITVLS